MLHRHYTQLAVHYIWYKVPSLHRNIGTLHRRDLVSHIYRNSLNGDSIRRNNHSQTFSIPHNPSSWIISLFWRIYNIFIALSHNIAALTAIQFWTIHLKHSMAHTTKQNVRHGGGCSKEKSSPNLPIHQKRF